MFCRTAWNVVNCGGKKSWLHSIIAKGQSWPMTPAIPDLHPVLTAAYSGDELATLCADYFRDVYENFAAGMTKAQKILLLLDYCQRRELLLNLVAALELTGPSSISGISERMGEIVPHARGPSEVPDRYSSATRIRRGVATGCRPTYSNVAGRRGSHLPASGRARSGLRRSTGGWQRAAYSWWCSPPPAVDSPWVTDETNAAIMLTNKGKLRFIPAEVASCDAPPLWELYQWIPFTVRYADGLSALLATLGQGAVAPPRTPDPVRAGGAPPGRDAITGTRTWGPCPYRRAAARP